MSFLRTFILFLISILFLSCCGIAESEDSVRWAVLSDSDFGDLLTTELSAIEDIELLERSEIDKVVKELEISAILSPKEVGKRLELGRILSADRLLVLHKEKNSPKIRTVIFDTKTAARIFETEFTDETEETAKAISASVERVQKSFKDGVRTVLAVTDFVSKSTSDDFNVYGESFPRILSLSLLQENGIAVVSFEEFNAIRRELEISGQNIERSVPLLIHGEFSGTKKNDERLFDLKITVSDGLEESETFFKESLTEQDAASFLSGEIVKSIMQRLGNEDFTPLSLEEQEARFSKIANQFHEYTAFDQAIRYREAILLLNPKNTLERLRLIDEISVKIPKRKQLVKTYPHIKYLFENRSISIEHGKEIYYEYVSTQSQYVPNDEWPQADIDQIDWELLSVLPEFLPAETPEDRHLYGVWGKASDLYFHEYRHSYIRNAASLYKKLFLKDEKKRKYTKDILYDIIPVYERLPLNIIPFTTLYWMERFLREDEQAALEFVQNLRKSKKKNLQFAADFTELYLEIEVREEISESSLEKIDSLRKKLEELTPTEYTPKGESFEDISYHKNALDDFENTVREKLYGIPEREPAGPLKFASPADLEPESPRLVELQFSIEPILEWPEIVQEHFTLKNSTSAINLEKLDDTTDIIWSEHTICLLQKDPEGRINARRIHRTNKEDRILSLCFDERNIWYAKPEGVFCMDREGNQIAHFGEKDGLPEFVTENQWGNKYNNIRLAPIAPDEILLYGRFGRHDKTWVARLMLNSQMDTLEFKLLLQAYRNSNDGGYLFRESYGEGGGAVDLAFHSSFINGKIRLGPENKHYAIIGRYFSPLGSGVKHPASPLWIDLETNRVSCLTKDFPELRWVRGGQNCVSANGSLVHVVGDRSSLYGQRDTRLIGHLSSSTSIKDDTIYVSVNFNDLSVCTPPEKEGDKWTIIDISQERVKEEARFRLPSFALIKEGDIVYSPGFPWLKLDFSSGSLKLEEIAEMSFPFSHPIMVGNFGEGGRRTSLSLYRESAVFGVWAVGLVKTNSIDIDWEKAYRIDWNKPMKQEISPFALHVPFDKLSEHDATVSRIRSLGGFVENNSRFEVAGAWSFFYGIRNRDEPTRGTVVALTADWKGSPEDLKLMNNLNNFIELYIMDRNLSREEVKAIETCQNLRGLYFIRSSMDSEDLSFLPWKNLHYLVLDSSEGKPGFDDRFIKTAFELQKERGNPNYYTGIKCLILCGPGFTEETFKLFTETYFPPKLRLLNTKISEDSIKKWNKKLSKEGRDPVNVSFK